MLQFIAWYLTMTMLGWVSFPLAYRLLPALADRGYALSRCLGLLIWGFVFWLAVSLGLSQNNAGGLLLALVVLAGLSGWAATRPVDGLSSLRVWLKANLRYVLSVEALFVLAFGVWTFVRANNPDIISSGGEKWMEVAFINAIMRSPTFPPHDPWLSGYAISYYYFGYVMTAMLAELTATAGSVAFNLMLALVFGLSVIGAYGLLYNLLRAYWAGQGQPALGAQRSMLGAGLAPLFMLLLGNWEALLEILHKRGIGWTGAPGDVNLWTRLGVGYPTTAAPGAAALPAGLVAPYNFWTWLNIMDLKDPPGPVFGGMFSRLLDWWNSGGFVGLGRWFSEAFMPDRGGWWWWRASRVVVDYDLRGGTTEIIDEFPAFSYLLGDLHPHVLAMPFALLVGALALNLYLGGWQGRVRLFKLALPRGVEYELNLPIRLDGFLLLAVALGGLAFLNTWAFPIYLTLVAGALILNLAREHGWSLKLLADLFEFAVPLALLSLILYLPFYVGFSSQAGGIVPNVIFPTRGTQLWIMFGGLFIPLFAFLIYLRRREPAHWRWGFVLAGAACLALWMFSTGLGIAVANTDIGRQFVSDQGFASTWDILRAATERRILFGGGLLTLLLVVGGAAAYLIAIRTRGSITPEASAADRRSPLPFVLMFILVGGLLVLAPDFVFLRDQFGARMNTVFKFYYESWALWSIAAAFGVAVMLSELRRWGLAGFRTLVVVLVGIGLLFPLMALPNKTNDFEASDPQQRTLDGAAYRAQVSPDDVRAILWLQSAPMGVVAEAAKAADSYTEYARVATYSGNPTVLGWDGHESQWRGGYTEMGTRQADLQRLYSTHDWATAQSILAEYGIHYVYIGPLERQTYAVYDAKFSENLPVVYSQGQVVIYAVP